MLEITTTCILMNGTVYINQFLFRSYVNFYVYVFKTTHLNVAEWSSLHSIILPDPIRPPSLFGVQFGDIQLYIWIDPSIDIFTLGTASVTTGVFGATSDVVSVKPAHAYFSLKNNFITSSTKTVVSVELTCRNESE